MITYVSGNIFDSPAQVICNAVNCVGVMGRGLARDFKIRYPEMFADYVSRCARGEVRPGSPYLWENHEAQILNFPTKRHWRENSRLADIDAGLRFLAEHHSEMGIATLAMPALGCGNGNLAWEDVQPLMERHLSGLTLEVFAYAPSAAAMGRGRPSSFAVAAS